MLRSPHFMLIGKGQAPVRATACPVPYDAEACASPPRTDRRPHGTRFAFRATVSSKRGQHGTRFAFRVPAPGPDGPHGTRFASCAAVSSKRTPHGTRFAFRAPALGPNRPHGTRFAICAPVLGTNRPHGTRFAFDAATPTQARRKLGATHPRALEELPCPTQSRQ